MGSHRPSRIGQEVLVEFLEGDPDKPIITGRVYNAEQPPPYPLPAKDTQTGIKSRSLPGGGPSNFNEIRFEDKKGSEEVYMQAEKNLVILVKQDETRTVQHGNRLATISEGNDTLTVSKGNITTTAPAGTDQTEALKIVLDGKTSIKLVCGASSIELTPAMITINAPLVKIN